jgi:hypothetical protein
VTSRTHLNFEFNIDTQSSTHSAYASPSRAITDAAKLLTTRGMFSSGKGLEYEATAVVSSAVEYTIRPSGVIDISGHSAGSNPLVKGSPDIDTYVRIVVMANRNDANNRSLWIMGEVRGNVFPDAQVVIEDHRGNRQVLGTFDASGGSPFTDLFGSGQQNRLMEFGTDISVNSTGAFVGHSLDQRAFYKHDISLTPLP